ncbi:MAG: c-type cytochrome [Anaerolineae bacterium]
MLPLLRPIYLLLAVAFIFTGSVLAADDHRPQTVDRLSFTIHPFTTADRTGRTAGTHGGATFQPSNLLTLHPPPFNLQSSPNGADLYQFWCSTCHGDRGQGLTAEWRATWPEGKQNCWQSKCHAANHPPDGFTIPKKVPALIGPDALGKFNTAQDLYAYIRAAMPYWSPNLLKDDEYRAITIFLAKANYQAKGYPAPDTLPAEWATFLLHPELKRAAEPISKAVDSSPQSTPYFLLPTFYSLLPTPGLWLWLLLLVAGGIIIFFLARRFLFQPR